MRKEIRMKQAIIGSLANDENLICFSKTRNSESAYVTLLNESKRYITFRLSNHEAYSGFLSVPTFVTSKSNPLGTELRSYLDKASWFNIDYGDYFMMAVIKHSRSHKISFQIDDLYSAFSDEKQGMIFYEVMDYHSHRKSKIQVNGLDENVNQVMRKLFATTLISSYKKNNGELLVYLSEAGFRLLDIFSKDYIDKFSSDYENINWDNIQIPVN